MPAIALCHPLPLGALDGEAFAAGCGEPVDADALAFVGPLPRRVDELGALEAMERWVERASVHLQRVARVGANHLPEPEPVLRSPPECLEDDEIERALEQLDT